MTPRDFGADLQVTMCAESEAGVMMKVWMPRMWCATRPW